MFILASTITTEMKIYEVLIAFLNERVGLNKTVTLDEIEVAFPSDYETMVVYIERFALSGYLTRWNDDSFTVIERIPNEQLKVLLDREIIWAKSELGHSFGIYKR